MRRVPPQASGFRRAVVDEALCEDGALVYVGIHALLAVASYLFIVGDIKRIELKPMAKASRQ